MKLDRLVFMMRQEGKRLTSQEHVCGPTQVPMGGAGVGGEGVGGVGTDEHLQTLTGPAMLPNWGPISAGLTLVSEQTAPSAGMMAVLATCELSVGVTTMTAASEV